MAQYKLEIKKPATKELSKLPPDIGLRLLQAIESLSNDPRPTQSQKLRRSHDSYRLRIGDYRVLYIIDDETRVVAVYRIGHRREVYR